MTQKLIIGTLAVLIIGVLGWETNAPIITTSR